MATWKRRLLWGIMTARMPKRLFSLFACISLVSCAARQGVEQPADSGGYSAVWLPDRGDGTYRNPVIYSDYSDPDVIRLGDDFYLTSSSFNCVPGLPILHSKDLVNWEIIGHALMSQHPVDIFNKPQHGMGVWAPSIRFRENQFYIYYGDPDYGIYLVRGEKPEGPWGEPLLLKKAKGWIDPCPFWDEDGRAYLLHAWAKSRTGINSILTLHRMNPAGTEILDDGILVFDGKLQHPTIEGPKMYKRNGYYYIFAPAGGVKTGWQTVLRSRNIYGPYEDRIVMDKGKTNVNGPHQGAWIELAGGQSWFVHFQDLDAYGRVVHLQPMKWVDNWPVIGADKSGSGKGEPVESFIKPDIGRVCPRTAPQVSDEFESDTLGLMWQWHANPLPGWARPVKEMGVLRMNAVPLPEDFKNFWDVPNLLLQKLSAPEFMATAKVTCNFSSAGEKTGLIVMGTDYSYISLALSGSEIMVSQRTCLNADKNGNETENHQKFVSEKTIYLRVRINYGAVCIFSCSTDGSTYSDIGVPFLAKPGKWVGAKVGLFCVASKVAGHPGYADFDWFHVENL